MGKPAHFVLSPLCLAVLGFAELVPVPASVLSLLLAPKAGLALGRQCYGAVLCIFLHCQASPMPHTQRGTQTVPEGLKERCWGYAGS